MRDKLNGLWLDFWYVLLGLGVAFYFIPGCTSAEDVKLGVDVTLDAASEVGPEIITKAVGGDYIGAGIAIGTGILGAVGAYFTARKMRNKKVQ